MLENVSKLQGMVKGAVAHLPRGKIHDIKSNLVGYHHLEGLWDWSTYNRFRGMITMPRNYETPCSCDKFDVPLFAGPCLGPAQNFLFNIHFVHLCRAGIYAGLSA